MRWLILLLPILLHFQPLAAQQVFPPGIGVQMNAWIAEVQRLHQEGEYTRCTEKLQEIDQALKEIEPEYSAWCGLVSAFEAYYAVETHDKQNYQNLAVSLLSQRDRVLVDSMATGFYNAMVLFYNAQRMDEWWPIDSMFRLSLVGTPTLYGLRYAMVNEAAAQLKAGNYTQAKILGAYDFYTTSARHYTAPMDKLNLMYEDWLIAKCDLESWRNLDYDKRHPKDFEQIGQIVPEFYADPEVEALRNMDFKQTYLTLISRIKELQEEMVLNNGYDKSDCDTSLRRGYYNIYTSTINDFCSWAKEEHKEGQVILALKSFLYEDIVKNEIHAAQTAKVRPVIPAANLVDFYITLAQLYDAIGNGAYVVETASDAMDLMDKIESFSIDEQILGLVNILQVRISGYRLQGDYTRSLKDVQFLKKYTPLPKNAENMRMWERYMNLYIQEVYTLLAMENTADAWDTLKYLLHAVDPIEEQLYDTKHWPQLQYLTAIYKSSKGDWDQDLMYECYTDLRRDPTYLDIFYPVQLLYFKTIWRTENKISTSLLNNLLFFTGQKIKYTFFMLTADERMRLYEQKMSMYFDVYHELIFTHKLDSFPEIKERVIAQSLSIKNALADGNLISNEMLMRNGKVSLESAESTRQLVQESNALLLNVRLYNYQVSVVKALRDRTQSMWLGLLEKSGMDSLTQLTDWHHISSSLKAGQVYTETMRYTRWLSDSSATYGTYIISNNQEIHYFNLCAETDIVSQLKNPKSSPQIAALHPEGNRGSSIILIPSKMPGKFHPDSTDKLAELIVNPLLPYVKNQEWFMVQDGLLNRISFAALKTKEGYLVTRNHLHTLTSSNSLYTFQKPMPENGQALLAGGLNYGVESAENNSRLLKTGYSWNYLPGTKTEVQDLGPLFVKAGQQLHTALDDELPDSSINSLKQFNFIHLATHGFYLDTAGANQIYSEQINRRAMRAEPLFRCGIVVSAANNPQDAVKTDIAGYFMGYELANIDLRKCYLITLSACETGLGDLRNNLGVDGLSRALKIAGAQNLLISLWKVPDKPTALFMQQFYTHLFDGNSPAEALRLTQIAMSQTHPVSDWAAFVLVN